MSSREITLSEAARIGVSATPGAAGTTWTWVDGQVLLSIVVGGLTAILVGLQIAHLIWKWRREARSSEEVTA